MNAHATVDEILAQYAGLSQSSAVALGNRGGFSGARLWRIASPFGALALKAWPPNTTAAKLRSVHQLMHAARESGRSFVPAVLPTTTGDTCLTFQGRVWDLTIWMPGIADFHANPTKGRLEAACKALAMLHQVWRNEATPPEACPAIQRRFEVYHDWKKMVDTGWLPPSEAQPLWRLVSELAPRVPSLLTQWTTPVSVQPCLCDIWHDHVLFTDDRVTGLIDYGSVKVDHVAVDLARLLGSLVGDDANMIDVGLQAYRSVAEFSADEERLMRMLDVTGAISAGINWLRWLYVERRHFDDHQAVQRRVASVLDRLRTLYASP